MSAIDYNGGLHKAAASLMSRANGSTFFYDLFFDVVYYLHEMTKLDVLWRTETQKALTF